MQINLICETNDAKAKFIVGLTLLDDHQHLVRDVFTAANIWKALHDVLHHQTVLNQLYARIVFLAMNIVIISRLAERLMLTVEQEYMPGPTGLY